MNASVEQLYIHNLAYLRLVPEADPVIRDRQLAQLERFVRSLGVVPDEPKAITAAQTQVPHPSGRHIAGAMPGFLTRGDRRG